MRVLRTRQSRPKAGARRIYRAARLLALSAILALPLSAEEFDFAMPSTCGDLPLAKGDLGLLWIKDGAVISEPAGVSLTVHAGDVAYTLTGLPDVAAGGGSRYSVTFEACGVVGIYRWPLQTRTPQSVVFRGTFRSSGAELGAGDTLPKISVTVNGLAADPTGATVTFSMADDQDPATTPKVDEAAATLADIDQAADLTWTATATYAWTSADTDTAGRFFGWFTITYPVADCGPLGDQPCISTWPPDRDIGVRINP